MPAAVDGPPTPDGDVDRGPTISAVVWVECAIASALLLARLWTRLRILKAFGWDDAFICLALVGGSRHSSRDCDDIPKGRDTG